MIEGSIASFSSISRTLGPTTSVANRLTGDKSVAHDNRIILRVADEAGEQKNRLPASLSMSSSSVKVCKEFNWDSDGQDMEMARREMLQWVLRIAKPVDFV